MTRPVQLFGRTDKAGTALMVMARIGETIAALCDHHHLKTAGMQVIVNGMLAGEEVDADRGARRTLHRKRFRPRNSLGGTSDALLFLRVVRGCLPHRIEPRESVDVGGRAAAATAEPKPSSGRRNFAPGEARESMHCIGCGLCSYVCPTRLPLMQRTLRLRGWVVGEEPPDADG